jgi:hypothetical protein
MTDGIPRSEIEGHGASVVPSVEARSRVASKERLKSKSIIVPLFNLGNPVWRLICAEISCQILRISRQSILQVLLNLLADGDLCGCLMAFPILRAQS